MANADGNAFDLRLNGATSCEAQACNGVLQFDGERFDVTITGRLPWPARIELAVTGDLLEHDAGLLRLDDPSTAGAAAEQELTRLLGHAGVIGGPRGVVQLNVDGRSRGSAMVARIPTWSSLPRLGRVRGVLLQLTGARGIADLQGAQVRTISKPLIKDAGGEAYAEKLLRDFLAGKRTAERTFQVKYLGQLLAVVDLLAVPEALASESLFFFLEPNVLRLEVGTDPRLGTHSQPAPASALNASAFAAKLLRDPAVHQAYRAALETLRADAARAALPFDRAESERLLARADLLTRAAAERPVLASPQQLQQRARAQEQLLAQHPYLRRGAEANHFELGPGTFTVQRPMVLEPGDALLVHAGTTLEFVPGTSLVTYGPVDARGTADQPVVMRGKGGADWGGVAVLSTNTTSHWKHAQVYHAVGPIIEGRQLCGGVTFGQADLVCDHCVFADSNVEDTLHLAGGRFELNDTQLLRGTSDLLDADVANGVIRRSLFRNAGGDGVDTAGGTVEVIDARIEAIVDKGISAGERSKLLVRGARIKDVAFGAAAKDGSTIELTDATISGATAGLLTYRNAASLGHGALSANRVTVVSTLFDTMRQSGSRLEWNGVQAPTARFSPRGFYLLGKLHPTRGRVLVAGSIAVALLGACAWLVVRRIRRKNQRLRLSPSPA